MNLLAIDSDFRGHLPPIFSFQQLANFINDHRDAWDLAEIQIQEFARDFIDRGKLELVRLNFPARPASRYVWGNVTIHELLQSLNATGYFSHYTAMHLNALTEQAPKAVYFNIEQTQSGGGGKLDQAGINRAFKGKCRVTTNIADYKGSRIHLLNGGNTDQLGVVAMEIPTPIRVTNIERTLIDATVRPVYSGGVHEVAKAFVAAKESLSANRLVAFLRTLGYTYPYHQAIGFYMERAGYRAAQLALLAEFPIDFDFYLDYGTKNPEFNSRWRVFHPHGM